jgi:hypothetical protein
MQQITDFYRVVTKCHGKVVNAPASYLEGLMFKSSS